MGSCRAAVNRWHLAQCLFKQIICEDYKNRAILLAFWSFYMIIAGTQGPCGSRSGLLSFQKENQDSKQLTRDRRGLRAWGLKAPSLPIQQLQGVAGATEDCLTGSDNLTLTLHKTRK